METRILPHSGVEVELHFSKDGPGLEACLIRLLGAAGDLPRKEAAP